MRVIVLGIGNTLMSDEGLGVHAVEALRSHALPPEVQLIDGGTSGMELLGEIAGADLLVVGSPGHGFWSRLLLGSVSQGRACAAPCSVEIVKRPTTPGGGEA